MTREFFVYIGTYTQPILFGTGDVLNGKGEGIYLYRMNPDTGGLTHAFTTRNVPNPSYLTLSPCGRFLYCVNELKEYEGQESGAASAFAVEPGSGKLRFLNSRPTGGTDPCHININGNGGKSTHVTVTNFMSGSVCVFPVEADGTLGAASRFFQHEGKSVHPTRQKGPHAHSLVFDGGERCAFVPDLGIDRIVIYKTDFGAGGLMDSSGSFVSAPGSGPRHCVFHPSGRYCYVINELNITVDVLDYDGIGSLTLRQTVPLVPEGTDKSGSIGADIRILPGGESQGKYLYASIRGLDTVSILKVEPTGLLSLRGSVPSGGRTPRSFSITPDGGHLLAANQDTDNVVIFRIDPDTGALKKTAEIHVPTPVCVTAW
ncbi:MAG: lactonase family protein [Synergistaceae bacterium]|jgi:6-phosphogluconolactonase|nr:lactonase family protein [Synergistaceae bacterium]